MMNTRRYVEVSLCFTLNAMENNITSVPLLMHLPGKTITCLPKANLFCDNLSRFFVPRTTVRMIRRTLPNLQLMMFLLNTN